MCRFVSVDPLAPKYAHLSPYAYAANKPINNIDIDGAETPGETTTPTGNSPATEESSGSPSGQSNVPRIHGIHAYQVLRYLGLIPEAESRGDLSRNMGGYQMTPHYSNIDGKDQLLFYSAYNKASGEIDYIVGPGSFKEFASDQGRYIIAASLMNNMSEGDLKRASGLELMQMGYTKEGWAMAWEGAVDVWKEALKSPEFYLSVINGLAVRPTLKGSGPASGIIEVSDRVKSFNAFKNYSPGNPVEFVFDTKRNIFVVGAPNHSIPGLSPHQNLAKSIGGNNRSEIVGGTFSRGKNGEILTTENSGHYGENWTPENREKFKEFIFQKTQQSHIHREWE